MIITEYHESDDVAAKSDVDAGLDYGVVAAVSVAKESR